MECSGVQRDDDDDEDMYVMTGLQAKTVALLRTRCFGPRLLVELRDGDDAWRVRLATAIAQAVVPTFHGERVPPRFFWVELPEDGEDAQPELEFDLPQLISWTRFKRQALAISQIKAIAEEAGRWQVAGGDETFALIEPVSDNAEGRSFLFCTSVHSEEATLLADSDPDKIIYRVLKE